MKKMIYGSLTCKISAAEDYKLFSQVPCKYGKETIAYAVERFFASYAPFYSECIWKSWKLRTMKGKKGRRQRFQYLVPSVLLELPGKWVMLCGDIDAVGVTVKKVGLLPGNPCTGEEETPGGTEADTAA